MPISLLDLQNTPPPFPQIPTEVWNTVPQSWGDAGAGNYTPGPAGMAGTVDPSGILTAFGGTQYENPEALRLGDWHAYLGSSEPQSAQKAIDEIPTELLDKYWPVDYGPSPSSESNAGGYGWNAMNLPGTDPNPVQGGGYLVPGGVGRPTPGDPLGGWWTIMERSRQQYTDPNTGGPFFMYNPPPGTAKHFGYGPSTNNWRLLPPGFRNKNYKMRGGRIIDKYFESRPGAYAHMGEPEHYGSLISGGEAAPMGVGFFQGPAHYFWPGDVFGAVESYPGLDAGACDRRLKTDIEYLGEDPDGIAIYAFRYKNDPKHYPKVVGPMADEVERKYPGSTHMVGGYRVIRGLR